MTQVRPIAPAVDLGGFEHEWQTWNNCGPATVSMNLSFYDHGYTQVEAARALVYAAARMVDSGAKNVTEASASSKVFASDTAMRIATDAVQICGGTGYMRDFPAEKMMRDAKILQIYEGTNQILRNAIAIELRKRKARTP